MVDLAKTRPELVVLMTALDCDDMLLGVSNGVVDLKTGKLLPASRQQLMTRQSPVVFDKAGKCPDFLKFLARVTGNNKSLMKYLQRVVGYCLTGMATEQCLFFLHGKGANGKSTFLNVLRELVGTDYAAQTPPETLMAKRNSGATNDIARLNGLRIVVANEVEDSTHLAESLVKQLTGGDAVSARFLHHEFFEFTPKFKLFIAGNHKPVIRGRDEGIWRRIQLVPFEVTIPIADRDAQLQQKLRAEASGILNWAIAGCKEWRRMGLVPPQVVVDAVKAYRDEMDILTDWINERCATGPALEWQSTQAYQSYKAWAEDGSYKPMTIAAFGREFGERYTRVKKSSGNFYRGICHRLPGPRHRLEDVEGLVRFRHSSLESSLHRGKAL